MLTPLKMCLENIPSMIELSQFPVGHRLIVPSGFVGVPETGQQLVPGNHFFPGSARFQINCLQSLVDGIVIHFNTTGKAERKQPGP